MALRRGSGRVAAEVKHVKVVDGTWGEDGCGLPRSPHKVGRAVWASPRLAVTAVCTCVQACV